MKDAVEKRSYDMTTRARRAAATEHRILLAVVDIWREEPIQDITLEKVAERAEVTVRTILRKYGSKEGLLEAAIEKGIPEERGRRQQARVGEVDSIVYALLAEYETIGDAVVRTVVLEDALPMAAKIARQGRQKHRQWCAHVFAPFLPPPGVGAYEEQLLAFVAATEIYVWHLLRRRYQLSADQTRHIFRQQLEGLIRQFKQL